jgi:hypothetical protein
MEDLPVISETYHIYKQLVILNGEIDKTKRAAIGEPAVETCLSILSDSFKAKYAPGVIKEKYISLALSQAELLTLQIRLILELKIANETNCFKIQSRLKDVRQMLGGWLKSVRL